MKCQRCGVSVEEGYTTSVTDEGSTLVIVRNVPCYKCKECNETLYTADVVARLEKLIESAKTLMQEIAVIDYAKTA